ncbi:hypothetical protein B0J17DRAFT_549455, partial [Rhizoctonia solani]
LRTGDGTHNLLTTAKACDRHCDVLVTIHANATGRVGRLNILGPDEEFSDPLHVALLAIECAHDRRPFNAVTNDLRHAQVQLLRPGTHLPTAATVSNHVRRIYEGVSFNVAQYLQV